MIADPPSSTLSDRLIQRLPSVAANPATTQSAVDSLSVIDARTAIAQQSARQYLAPLYRLETGWDSYAAQPPKRSALHAAEWLLTGLLLDGFPLPAITPVADGSVTLEWTATGYEFAMMLDDPGSGPSLGVYYLDETTETEWEYEQTGPNPDDRLVQALNELRLKAT